MKTVCVINETKRVSLARQVQVASTVWDRCVGLLGRSSLKPDTGLWLTPCRSVHTLFMRFPIDVVFLDPQGVVLAGRTPPALETLALDAVLRRRLGTSRGNARKDTHVRG